MELIVLVLILLLYGGCRTLFLVVYRARKARRLAPAEFVEPSSRNRTAG